MPLVIAKATGFYGHLREAGERFEIQDDEELGAWMVLANADGTPKLTKDQKAGKAAVSVVPAAEVGSVPSSAPFTPPAIVYTVSHVPVGNYAVVDADGQQVGDVFKAVKGENGAAKIAAQQEADRLNAEAAVQSPLSPAQAARVGVEDPIDDNLPDA